MTETATRINFFQTISPLKLCECGCGQAAPLAPQNDARKGHVKGQPMRFVHGHHRRGMTGSAGAAWKGGRYVTRSGHTMLFVGQAHPMANGKGYVAEHRIVLASALGRTLTSAEDVHHVDLDPRNNQIGNLIVVTRGEHQRIHRLIEYRDLTPLGALVEALA